MKIQKKPISDIASLNRAIRKVNKEFTGQVWWRGQRDFDWDLAPSLFRRHDEYDERSAILRFKQRALSRHPDVPATSDLSSWLFLMQHYRLPTRLLDWTESPLIACFFASEIDECQLEHPKEIEDKDGALFALSPYRLNETQIGRHALLMPEDDYCTSAMAPAFDETAQEMSKVVAVRPAEVDIRLMVQMSAFTLNGYNVALENLEHSNDFVLKFRVSRKSKEHLLGELKRLGIRLSSIFPDLEHLAEEIRLLGFSEPETKDEIPGQAQPLDGAPGATMTELSTKAVEGDTG